MKLKVVTILMLCMTMASFGQKIKFKKDKVLVDGKEMFNFERRALGTEISIYNLGTDDEIIYMIHNNNETPQYQQDDFTKMVFIEEDVIIESTNLVGSWKRMIQTLIKQKVIDENGKINVEKLGKFRKKYDENITNRTVRY